MSATPDTPPSIDDWALRLGTGQTIHVPNRLSSITTYVVLEQERWFESEIGFVARLLEPGDDALDIGANHGVYTLALTASPALGHLWAFEPTVEPRARLERTVRANALERRVTVVPCGLSDHCGPATFHTSAHSELNSMHADGGTREETVHLETLDAFAQRTLAGRRIGFVKIDAEGEEPRVLRGGRSFFEQQSPIVLFELIAGTRPNLGLVEQFQALGFGIFRHLPELDLLIEHRPLADDPDSWTLNLFAIKPDRQQRLADAGLLVRWSDFAGREDPAVRPHALAQLARQRPLHGLADPDPALDDIGFCDALAHAATARFDPDARAVDRVLHLLAARDRVQEALASDRVAHVAAWTLLVHCLHALGSRHAALDVARTVLQVWPHAAVDQQRVFMPLLASDLDRDRSTDAASWMRQTLAEFVECRGHYSSYFCTESSDLAGLLAHPDHGAEIERRYVLDAVRRDRNPDPRSLRLLPSAGATANSKLWRAWLDQLRAEPAPLPA